MKGGNVVVTFSCQWLLGLVIRFDLFKPATIDVSLKINNNSLYKLKKFSLIKFRDFWFIFAQLLTFHGISFEKFQQKILRIFCKIFIDKNDKNTNWKWPCHS